MDKHKPPTVTEAAEAVKRANQATWIVVALFAVGIAFFAGVRYGAEAAAERMIEEMKRVDVGSFREGWCVAQAPGCDAKEDICVCGERALKIPERRL